MRVYIMYYCKTIERSGVHKVLHYPKISQSQSRGGLHHGVSMLQSCFAGTGGILDWTAATMIRIRSKLQYWTVQKHQPNHLCETSNIRTSNNSIYWIVMKHNEAKFSSVHHCTPMKHESNSILSNNQLGLRQKIHQVQCCLHNPLAISNLIRCVKNSALPPPPKKKKIRTRVSDFSQNENARALSPKSISTTWLHKPFKCRFQPWLQLSSLVKSCKAQQPLPTILNIYRINVYTNISPSHDTTESRKYHFASHPAVKSWTCPNIFAAKWARLHWLTTPQVQRMTPRPLSCVILIIYTMVHCDY